MTASKPTEEFDLPNISQADVGYESVATAKDEADYSTLVRLKKMIKADIKECDNNSTLDFTEEKATIKEQLALKVALKEKLEAYYGSVESVITGVDEKYT